jgi:hypothetical protein
MPHVTTSLKTYLKNMKAPQEVKKQIVKKIKYATITFKKHNRNNFNLTLESAYLIIGKAMTQRDLIDDANKALMIYCNRYHSLELWAKELWEYRKSLNIMITLGLQMTKSIIHEQSKSSTQRRI